MSDKKQELHELEQRIHVAALVNPRSGAGSGARAMDSLSKQPNTQVFDLLDFARNADEASARLTQHLRQCDQDGQEVRLIVGGGDGTVTWAFSILDRICADCDDVKMPAVAHLALGTSNEVAGCAGWARADNGKRLGSFVRKVRQGQLFTLDLWNVNYIDNEPFENFIDSLKQQGDLHEVVSVRRPALMAAFMSVGLDAKVAFGFHVHREVNTQETPRTSRVYNKMIYVRYGTKEIFSPHEVLDHSKVTVRVDDREVALPSSRSSDALRVLKVLNINSMADGVDFWGTARSHKRELAEFEEPALDDALLEVCGSYSIHHMNRIRAGVGHDFRVAQGHSVDFVLHEPVHTQVDGEAWLQPPGTIQMRFAGSRLFVRGPKNNSSVRRGITRSYSSLDEFSESQPASATGTQDCNLGIDAAEVVDTDSNSIDQSVPEAPTPAETSDSANSDLRSSEELVNPIDNSADDEEDFVHVAAPAARV